MNLEILNRETVLSRREIVDMVRRWGDVNTEGALQSAAQFFTVPHIEGMIAYRIELSHAVVSGEPMCAKEHKGPLAKAFEQECRQKKRKIIYTLVSENFALWAKEHLNAIALEFGQKFIVDPVANPVQHTGPRAVRLRNKIKQAVHAGVAIKEYTLCQTSIEMGIEAVSTAWLQDRRGLQIYLSEASIFNDREGKRWFYAAQAHKIIGFLMLHQLQAQNGWLLNSVQTLPDAPKGVSEFLIASCLETLAQEGCRHVSMGPVASKQLTQIIGLSAFWSAAVQKLFSISRYFFNLDKHASYWDKFQPSCEKSFLVFPQQNLNFSSVVALLRAFNVGKK